MRSSGESCPKEQRKLTAKCLIRNALIGAGIGFAIGILGISYSLYHYFYAAGDNFEGAMAFMLMFGLPLSLLGAIASDLTVMCFMFVLNWIILGIFIGLILLIMNNMRKKL